MKPGIYYDLPPEEYYSDDSLGSSRLKAFAESPLHYKKFGEFKDTPQLAFGRAAHVYVLEGPEVFARHYAIMPEGMIRRGKQYEAFVALVSGKEIIKPEEFQHILGMREQLLESDARDLILREGYTEVSLFWEQYGIRCKGRLDKLIPATDGPDIMVDYKTTVSADPAKCLRAVETYKYWLQEAHYGIGYSDITEKELDAIFIFQEKTPPYDVCMVRVSNDAGFRAYDMQDSYMLSLAGCIERNNFPGRNAGKGILEWGFRDQWGFEEEEKEGNDGEQ